MSENEVRAEWRGWSLRTSLVGTIYLLGTGLVILLAPFGSGAQVSVLVHTVGGILFLVPILAYLAPHLLRRWRDSLSHLVLLGWLSGILMLTVIVSGVVLTIQAVFGRGIDYGWDLVHTIVGCAVGVIIVVHLLTAIRRTRPGESAMVGRMVAWTTGLGILLTAVTFLGGETISTPGMRQALPEGYAFRYGPNPFAPSLAQTDYLARVEKHRAWLKFLEEDPAPDQIAGFLEVVERQLQADRLRLQRGEPHLARTDQLDSEAERIDALKVVAAGKRGGIETLLEEVRRDLDAAQKEFESEGGILPAALAGSQNCGTSGCHEEITREWEPSAHRYSSRSAFFQLIQGAMAEANGAESTRYCAGCHDPISLFSGAKNIFHDDLSSPGADEGISCAVCHSIVQTDVQGNANYVVAPPERYLSEDTLVGQFLIRAYPRHHKATFGRPLMETPEFCGACHKQFIDKEINRATRVQLQNQYDAWKGSHWFVPEPDNPQRADPERSLACRDCHMRLTASGEPAAVRRGAKHRHHGYIAANQWLPLFHSLPGAEEHVRLTEEWLQGKTVIEEIADRWPGGPPVPLRIEAPETVKPGEQVKLRVIADNRKVGHTFPTGPLDVIQAWIEVTVTLGGKEIFRSGALDEDGFIRTGAWMLKAEGVDRAGNLIDRHNLWDMVGARFRRVLFPGYSDREEYTFECACEEETGVANTDVEFEAPAEGRTLEVTAVLHYRKVDQTLLNVLLPHGKARAPVTDMSRATARIRIEP